MDPNEIDAVVRQVMDRVGGHCGCGCSRAPLLRLRVREIIASAVTLAYAAGSVLPIPPALPGLELPELEYTADELPIPPLE